MTSGISGPCFLLDSSTLFPWNPAGRSIATAREHGNLCPRTDDQTGQGPSAVKLFVLDPHTIYRRGLAACLKLLDGVEAISDAESVRDAWENPALFEADLVILDHAMVGGQDFIGAVMESTGANVLVCTSDCSQEHVLAAMQAGAIG